MQEVDLKALGTHVLGAAFRLSVLFGAIARRTQFCTMGALADIVTMGDWARMRRWVLAMGVAMIGCNAMVALGGLEASNSICAGSRLMWRSMIVGGAKFGFGMLLASGCGAKTLVRIGGGNLKSLMVLIVLIVLGVAAVSTLKGITAVARVASVDAVAITFSAGQDLPFLRAASAGVPKPVLAAVIGPLLGGGLIAWALSQAEGRAFNNPLAGGGLGVIVVAAWWVSGRMGHVAEDPSSLQEAVVATNSKRMESLSCVAPVACTLDWLMLFCARRKLLTTGIVSVFGLVAGSAAHALLTRSFRREGFRDAPDTGKHLIGALLMGVGGVTALGCTVGQGLSGVATLSVGSFIALAAIIGGAIVALPWQAWCIEQAV